MNITIEDLNVRLLSDEDLELLYEFDAAMHAETRPSDPRKPIEVMRQDFENIPEYLVLKYFVARGGNREIVGTASADWVIAAENTHLAEVKVRVRSDHRRRGLGSALLRRVLDAAASDGRTLLLGTTTDRVPDGRRFAQRLGAVAASRGHTHRLLISDVDRSMIARWIEEGPSRAPSYTLIAFDGPYPDDAIDAIVALHEVTNTAPRDDIDMEDQHLTVERMREAEKSIFATGLERWFLAAQRDDTGHLVGFTEVAWEPSLPLVVWQWDTVVRPEHRGHALGKWLKAAMLERILNERPEAIEVRTHNADSNESMLGINTLMGFQPFEEETTWQITVAEAKRRLDGPLSTPASRR